jgi:phosphoglycolate phosphatase
MSYKMIIFDFDGTLADSFSCFKKSINHCAKKYRFRSVQDSDIDFLRGADTKSIIKYLGIPWWKRPFVARHMRRLFQQELQSIKLFNGIDSVLRHLTEKKLAIVSSNSEENIRAILGVNNKLFVDMCCGISLLGKSRSLRKLMRKHRLKGEEVIYIGDETRDFDAALKSGMAFAPVLWGYADRKTLLRLPHSMAFEQPEDLLKLL